MAAVPRIAAMLLFALLTGHCAAEVNGGEARVSFTSAARAGSSRALLVTPRMDFSLGSRDRVGSLLGTVCGLRSPDRIRDRSETALQAGFGGDAIGGLIAVCLGSGLGSVSVFLREVCCIIVQR